MQKNTHMLLPLTSLRFFAAGMIVLLHSFGYRFDTFKGMQVFDLNQAVSFFFILSGFVLSYVYSGVTQEQRGKFFLARFARLWPAHLFAMILVMILIPRRLTNATHQAPLLLIPFAQLLMMHAWIPLKTFYASLNSVSWSISTEFFFYLWFPFLQSRTTRQLAACFGVSLGIVLLLVAACHMSGLDDKGEGLTLSGVLYVWPVCRILEFIAGMLTFRAWHRVKAAEQQAPAFTRASTLEILSLLMLLTAMYMSGPEHIGRITLISPALATFLGRYGFTIPFFAYFIYLMARGNGVLSMALSWAPLILLGEISYSMYLLHQPLLWKFQYEHPSFWLFILCLLGLSWLVWRLVEMPLRKFMVTHGANWLDAKKQASENTGDASP